MIKALEWLKLNHSDYLDIEISHENMNEYPEDCPPVVVDYHEVNATKDAESMAVNDQEEEEGTTEGICPFTVQTLTADELTKLLDIDDRGIIRNKALRHFKQGGKALGIGKAEEPESIYDNLSLYPQMFPWLFPYGLEGLGNNFMQQPVSEQLHKIGRAHV